MLSVLDSTERNLLTKMPPVSMLEPVEPYGKIAVKDLNWLSPITKTSIHMCHLVRGVGGGGYGVQTTPSFCRRLT